MTRPITVVLIALAVAGAFTFASVGQGFGESTGNFGESTTERDYTAVTPSAGEGSSYFVHDQLLKTLLLGSFLLCGSLVVILRRFRLRWALLVLSVAILGFFIGGFLCPLSSVQNVILKANTGYIILFALPVVFALALGRVFCGSVCPFGALQELLHIRRISVRIPYRVRIALRFIQWGLLLFLVVRVLIVRVPLLNELTPFRAFFTLGGTPLALALSSLLAALSLFLYRPFCRICPLGAVLGLVSRIRLYGVGTAGRCVSCAKCDAVCRFDAIRCGTVSSFDCLLCGDCLSSCPTHCLTLHVKPGLPRSDRTESE